MSLDEFDIDDLYGDDTSDLKYEQPAVMPANEAEALERANWHLRMAAKRRDERDQLAAVYKKEIERLQIRLQHRTRILNDQIAWHEEPVKGLHLALLRENPKRKTIELPSGKSSVRVPQTPKVNIVDNAAVLAWAEKEHPELISHAINVTAVRTVAGASDADGLKPGDVRAAIDTETGEIIPGCEVTLDPPSWSVSYD